jgi:CheY-like chemotaxis protein
VNADADRIFARQVFLLAGLLRRVLISVADFRQTSHRTGGTVHRKLVLVIDDNDAERELYGRLLWYNGFDVAFAETGEQGLELARQQPPDLVLLDMMLPGIDGMEVCDKLKRDIGAISVPVVALSGRSERELGAAARGIGCVKYLEKPISPLNVLYEVEELIGRPPPPGDGSSRAEQVA